MPMFSKLPKTSQKIDVEALYRSLGLNFADEQAKYIKQKAAESNNVLISDLSMCSAILGLVMLAKLITKQNHR